MFPLSGVSTYNNQESLEMHASVKPLQWLDAFCDSIGGAMGTGVTHREKDTLDPLLKTVTFEFGEELTGKSFVLIWNLLQSWAAKNNCRPQGKVEKEGRRMTVKMAIKGRFGLHKVVHPLGDKK